jgi:hypothetical protein
MGTGSFPEVKRPGRNVDHKPPSSAEVKKELGYTSTHPMRPPGPVTGFHLPLWHSVQIMRFHSSVSRIPLLNENIPFRTLFSDSLDFN